MTQKSKSSETTPKAKARSKIGSVVQMLERRQGATLDELVQATGWQPHTTRAALTGLRKKGHLIERRQRDNMSCYSIVSDGKA